MTDQRRRAVRDRDVLILLGLVVAAVLVANVIAAMVPGVDAMLAGAPLVVILLIAVTVIVLFRALRRHDEAA